MLFTEQTVLSAVQGGRKLVLSEGDRLTPAARDLLRRQGICVVQKKPEQMTHLDKDHLVAKTHPRIAFRGKLDSLQPEILLLQKQHNAPVAALEDMLTLIRSIMKAEVLNQPLGGYTIASMDEAELHERSHQPQKYYGIGHFLPTHTDGAIVLQLNRLRTLVRETELSCCHAFTQTNGKVLRQDLITALNRLSSACWVLCLACKGGQNGSTGG